MGSALSGRRGRGAGAASAERTGKPRKPARTRQQTAPTLDQDALREFGARLRAWYRRNARDLPWRKTRDPYAILVSELMLQQTQVSRVLDYWQRFLQRFPTLEALAEARERDVLRQWKGLGYYARARNLHKLSRAVVREGPRAWGNDASNGAGADTAPLPADPSSLRRLPGVGAYTAGAIASFAFERRAALVDTNVARVLARVFAPELNPKRPRDLTRLWAIAERSLPRTGKSAWTHNQALMELGALVCTARVRKCEICPVRRSCRSAASAPRSEDRGRKARGERKG